MPKILHIIHGLTIGGGETFIYNTVSGLDPENFHFDIAIQNPKIENFALKHLIEAREGKIFVISDFRKNIIKQKKQLKEILRGGYDYVHIHINALINPIPLIVSKRYCENVILHSHNTSNRRGGLIGKLLHKINSRIFIKENTIRLACGQEAGAWMFRDYSFTTINNAVDLNKFAFNPGIRKQLRKDLNINENSFIIGNIGRFVTAKNHKFLIDVFCDFNLRYPEIDTKLLLVGDGILFEEIKSYASNKKERDSIIITGSVSNPQDYYSAMDCFVLPSLFEGLAFVAVEAQASGLPVIASNTVTPDINISNYVNFLSIKASLSKWSDAILEILQKTERSSIAKSLINSPFDKNYLRKKMIEIYK